VLGDAAAHVVHGDDLFARAGGDGFGGLGRLGLRLRPDLGRGLGRRRRGLGLRRSALLMAILI